MALSSIHSTVSNLQYQQPYSNTQQYTRYKRRVPYSKCDGRIHFFIIKKGIRIELRSFSNNSMLFHPPLRWHARCAGEGCRSWRAAWIWRRYRGGSRRWTSRWTSRWRLRWPRGWLCGGGRTSAGIARWNGGKRRE